jgi:hypothetical protein
MAKRETNAERRAREHQRRAIYEMDNRNHRINIHEKVFFVDARYGEKII